LLDHDPDNVRLITDAASAAFEEGQYDEAAALLGRHEQIAPLTFESLHLAGLIAMRRQDWEGAAACFARLMEAGQDTPAIRFNRAWSLAMAGKFDAALDLLDRASVESLPQAAQLLVQLLHDRGDFDTAAAQARHLFALHPGHRGLAAVTATLAIDIEDLELARRAAEQAGNHPDALTTLGTLALGEDDPKEAALLFAAALARAPSSPRALVGRGLVRLLDDDKVRAAADLDEGAELFGTHLGSWIAAGWAHFVAGDRAAARQRFETALALDDNFAESHGSLAVVDLLDGKLEKARQQCEVALRLDRQCFSAALASMLLSVGAGDADTAQRIFEKALHTEIDASGRTVAQALARLGTRLG
jgi:tetratricopeptide (TPR) repeat protein